MKPLLLAMVLACWASNALAQPRSGYEIALQDCGACHAVGRYDRSKQPPAPPFRTLAAKYDVEGLAEALAEGISVGHPKMPEFIYPPDQIERLISYLKSLKPRSAIERPREGE